MEKHSSTPASPPLTLDTLQVRTGTGNGHSPQMSDNIPAQRNRERERERKGEGMKDNRGHLCVTESEIVKYRRTERENRKSFYVGTFLYL